MRYKTIHELLEMITDASTKVKLLAVYQKFRPEMHISKGSQHNHQAWEGGYIDHIVETMNIARLLFHAMNDKRKLPFTLSDALIVMFLHDIEKAFPSRIDEYLNGAGGTDRPKAKSKIKYRVLHEEGIWEYLSDDHKNALDHCEGENDSYTNEVRRMKPLATFCHMCDVASARLWFDNPGVETETWGHRTGSIGDEDLWAV